MKKKERNELSENAEKLVAYRNKKDNLKAELKETQEVIDSIEEILIKEMVDNEISKFGHNGKTFYIRTNIFPNVDAKNKETLNEIMKENGYAEIVKETINPATLRATIKEMLDNNEGELEDWLKPIISIYEKITIGVRSE